MTTKPRLCLSMIVKDETAVIRRCLESVKPYIQSWAVCDTGSSDGTQALIRDLMADLPGELIERPWKNFGHNRNEALELARQHGEYALIMDADDVLEVAEGARAPALSLDGYSLRIRLGDHGFSRVSIVRLGARFRWVGAVHETLVHEGPYQSAELAGWTIRCIGGGARSTTPTAKFERDIALLEEARRENPKETRTVFYLAQSYRDAGRHERALEVYRERVAMGGWEEEVWTSRYQAARLLEQLGRWPEALAGYLEAFEARPTRAEPLYQLARHFREQRQFESARIFAERAVRIRLPKDVLFVDESVYRWRCIDELAVAAYWVREYDLGRRLNQELLGSGELPAEQVPRVQKNLELCRKKLAEGG